MCDPFSALAFGMKAAGSIIGGMQQGKADDLQSQMYAANAANLRRQAVVAGLQQGLAYQRGALKETQLREEGDDTLGRQALWYASNNLDPAFGSPLVHQVTTVQRIERDAALVRANAALEGADAKSKAANLTSQAASQTVSASLASQRADQARFAGFMGAGNALLSFAGGSGGGSALDLGSGGSSFALSIG
jgi:hypothetical protein